MLCPFCLKENTIHKIEEGGRTSYVCSEHPEPKIPIIYAEKDKIPRDLISAIGFRGHGKSAYFTSLFASLDSLSHPNIWPRFSHNPVNEQSLDIVYTNVRAFNEGKLPIATPMNFPIPTIVEFSDMPKFNDRFLIFYDTGGESYERASRLIKNAEFVKKSQTAIFFISLHDIDYNPQEMSRLLSVYIQGLKELGGDPKQQHLLIVLTKGDLLFKKLTDYPSVWEYLSKGSIKNTRYSNIRSQISDMKKVSKLLKEFLTEDIGAGGFINLGKKNFKNVEVCIISALGSAPKGDQLDINATPKRIFDPIIWVMQNSTSLIPPFFFNLIPSKKTVSPIIHPIPPVPPRPYKKYIQATSALFLIAAVLWIVYPIATDFAEQNLQYNSGNQKTFSSLVTEGDRYLGEKKYYEALQKYNAALAINNNSVSVWEKRGDIYRILSENDLSKVSSSLSSYEVARNLDPGNFQILKKIGDLHYDNRDYVNAFRVYNDAISINPDFKNEISTRIGYLLNEAEFYTGKKDYSTAIATYDGILTYNHLDSHSEQLALLGKITCLYELGRNREAVETNMILQRKFYPDQYSS